MGKYTAYKTLHRYIFFLSTNSVICAEITLIYSLERDEEMRVKQWISSYLVPVVHLLLLYPSISYCPDIQCNLQYTVTS